MKDTCKILRFAIFNALSGNITYNSQNVPVYDEKQNVSGTENVFILLSTQQETNQDTSESFITRSSITFEVVCKTGFEVSKDVVDDVYQSVMEILLPTTQTIGITVPSGFQFLNASRESSNTITLDLSTTESIIRRLTTLVFIIVQK